MSIEDILNSNLTEEAKIAALKEKSIIVPAWGGKRGLRAEYDPKMHPVMDKVLYPDIANADGTYEAQTRITLDLQRLATKRMTELSVGTPVKRIYSPDNDRQKEIASYIEAILTRNRIDTVNNERCSMLFAGCEVLTLWYAVEQRNNTYGFDAPLKLRCRNFSPMLDDQLYPLFNEYGDMVAMSIGYRRRVGNRMVQFFDAYTADRHIKWSNGGSSAMTIVEDEKSTLLKIPGIYWWRPTPIWEDTSKIVYEMEWALSRNGNYLRKNSKPIFAVFSDGIISYGQEGDEKEGRSVVQFPKGATAQYITWSQAVENLKYFITELRQSFFTQLQLPDWSYESMKSVAMSGESRKQLFIDAHLKVRDESGRLIEGFDREVNVIKAFLKTMLPANYHADIDALRVENVVSPFVVTEEKDTINTLMTANGGKPLMSQRESIENLGWSSNVDRTLQEIQEQEIADVYEQPHL
jgi:hypothetical protein